MTIFSSIQSEPTFAIVSAGHSVLSKYVHESGLTQFNNLNGLNERLYDPVLFRNAIQSVKTKFLFTWGLQEQGIYLVEANEKITFEYLKGLNNASIKIGNYGHVFPIKQISDFLNQESD